MAERPNKRASRIRQTACKWTPYVAKRPRRHVVPPTPWVAESNVSGLVASAHINRKLPPCNMANLPAWFMMVECDFDIRNVTCPKAKYKDLVTSFTPDLVELVFDAMADPNIYTYEDIKAIILKRATEDPYAALQFFMSGTDLGGLKPSAFLRHARILVARAGQTWGDEYTKKFLIGRMPPHARTALIAAKLPLDELAAVADEMLRDPVTAATTAAVQIEGDCALTKALAELQTQVGALQTGLTEMRDTRRRSPSPRPRHRSRPPASRPSSPPRRPQYGPPRHGARPHDVPQRDDEFCWYHATFGSRAANCRRPCTWSGNGPDRS